MVYAKPLGGGLWERTPYMITAGHCGGDATHGWWQQAKNLLTNPPTGFYIGAPNRNSYVDNSAADAQRVPINRANQGHQIQATDTTYFNITSWQYSSQDVVGESYCQSGSTSHRLVCGVLRNRNLTFTNFEPTLVRQRYGTAAVAAGDSGGPNVDGGGHHQAQGITFGTVDFTVNGVTTQYGVYSQIGEVNARMGTNEVAQ